MQASPEMGQPMRVRVRQDVASRQQQITAAKAPSDRPATLLLFAVSPLGSRRPSVTPQPRGPSGIVLMAAKRDPRSALARETLQTARNLAADERFRRLPHAQRLFLLVGLLEHADAQLVLWPRIKRWASEAGVSERTAKEALASVREFDLLHPPLLKVKRELGKRKYQFDPALVTAHLDGAEADSAPAEGKSRTPVVHDLPPDSADPAPVPNEAIEREKENEEQERSCADEKIDDDLALALRHFGLTGTAWGTVVEAYEKNPGGLAEAMLQAVKKNNPGAYLAVLLREGVHELPATTKFSRVRYAITGRDPLEDLPRCERCGFQPYERWVLREVVIHREGKPVTSTVCDYCERELEDSSGA
jgi:hypothetical protein